MDMLNIDMLIIDMLIIDMLCIMFEKFFKQKGYLLPPRDGLGREIEWLSIQGMIIDSHSTETGI